MRPQKFSPSFMSAKGKFKTQRNKAGVGVTKAVFPSAF
jgi:hypothetical protein